LLVQDKAEADLLIVIGSSLKVRPVALIPSSLPPGIPQVRTGQSFIHPSIHSSIHQFIHPSIQ
jgi:NAD-dependent deacetylase sirtuin 1